MNITWGQIESAGPTNSSACLPSNDQTFVQSIVCPAKGEEFPYPILPSGSERLLARGSQPGTQPPVGVLRGRKKGPKLNASQPQRNRPSSETASHDMEIRPSCVSLSSPNLAAVSLVHRDDLKVQFGKLPASFRRGGPVHRQSRTRTTERTDAPIAEILHFVPHSPPRNVSPSVALLPEGDACKHEGQWFQSTPCFVVVRTPWRLIKPRSPLAIRRVDEVATGTEHCANLAQDHRSLAVAYRVDPVVRKKKGSPD